VGFVLVLPLFAAQDKKDLDKPAPTENLVKVGTLTAKVVAVVESKKALRVRYEYLQYNLKVGTKDIELSTIEDVKVRLRHPPPKFDDKGKLAKYTAKELQDLKGKENLPGYSGQFSDIASDQVVTLTLVRKKGEPVRPAARPRGKDADADLLTDNLPQVSAVMVEFDPANVKAGK
jgi:hypothetical protein